MKAQNFFEKFLLKIIFLVVTGIVIVFACFVYILFTNSNNQYIYGRDVVCYYGNDDRIFVSKNYNGTWYCFSDLNTNYQNDNVIDYKITNFGLINSKLYLNSSDGLYIFKEAPFEVMFINFRHDSECITKIKKYYETEKLIIVNGIENLENDDKTQVVKLLNLLENEKLLNFYVDSMYNRMKNYF